MAFKILTDEEKAFLTEEELAKYDEQLRIYQMRVNFVNQLEKFENAEIKPYIAKKKAVKVVEKIQISDVMILDTNIRAENKVSEMISEIKLLNKIDSQKFSEGMKADVSISDNSEKLNSIVKKCDGLSDIHISLDVPSLKIERKEYSAPLTKKANVPLASVTGIPENSPVIPDTNIKISIPDLKVAEINISEKVPSVKDDDFKISMPDSKIRNINVPDTVKFEEIRYKSPVTDIISVEQPVIHNVDVNHIEIKKHTVCLDNVHQVDINAPEVKSFKISSPSVSVPEQRNIDPVKTAEFKKPVITSPAELPDVPDVKTVNIHIPGVRISNIPEIKIPDINSMSE